MAEFKTPRRLLLDHPIAGTVVVSVALVLIVSLIAHLYIRDPKTDLAAWVEAISALATFGAALVAGIFAARVVRIERARDDLRDKQLRSSQASLVAAWRHDTNIAPSDDGSAQVVTGVLIKLRNASDVPVSRVYVDVTLTWWASGHQVNVSLGSNQYLDGVLPPGEELMPVHSHPIALPTGLRVEIQLSFVDAAGWSWTRTADGILIEGSRVTPEHVS